MRMGGPAGWLLRGAAVAIGLGLAAGPVEAQTLSPMTGTTASPPVTGATVSPPMTGSAGPITNPARGRRLTLQQRFEAANTSHDGKLTLEQARAGSMKRVADRFDAIDAGKRGYVTTEDIRAYNRAERAARAK